MIRLLFVLAITATRLNSQSLSTSFSFGGSGSTVYSSPTQQSLLMDTPQSIAVDPAGNMYVAGTSFSSDFPEINALTPISPLQCTYNCIFRAPFVAKIDTTGSFLIYSTLLGSPSSSEAQSLLPISVAVDTLGNAYITGTTAFPNFPAAKGTALTRLGGLDAFLIKLDPTGNVVYSTLFGGPDDDRGAALVLGGNGTVHVVRTTTSANSSGSDQDLYLTTFDASTGRILATTFLGKGTNPQIALAPAGQLNVVVTTTCIGCSPRVIAKRIDALASTVLSTSSIGGDNATLIGAAGGADGSLYVAASTSSGLPTTPNVLGPQPVPNSGNQFLTHLDNTGATVYSTYLSGLATAQSSAFAVDNTGNAYIGGTAGPAFPTLHAVQPNPMYSLCAQFTPSGGLQRTYLCTGGGFITAINPTATAVNWSTFAGSSFSNVDALTTDAKGNVYAAGKRIALSGPFTGKPISVLKFIPQLPALTISAQSITNAASYDIGLPEARSLASIFISGLSNITGIIEAKGYPLPTVLAGVSVKVNGVPAPLLSIADTGSGQQMNFQVPSMDRPTGSVVQISQGNNSAFVGALPAPPGIFTSPEGIPAIQHAADYSLVTQDRPASPGEILIVYATGIVDTNPSPQDGTPFTKAMQEPFPPSVLISGRTAEILYAGPTPNYVGLYQINMRVPDQLPSGPQNLTLTNYQTAYAFYPEIKTVSKPVTVPVK